MDIASAVVSMCAVCMAPGIVRLIKDRKAEWAAAGRDAGFVAAARIPGKVDGRRLRWISPRELAQMVATDPELVVFCLVEGPQASHAEEIPGQVTVTLPQLEETLPWIPAGSRIALYRAGGIDAVLARRLAAMTRGRETYALSGSLRAMPLLADLTEFGPCD